MKKTLTTIILGTLLVAGISYAKEVKVDVVSEEETKKLDIQAEKIQANDQISIVDSFSLTDRLIVKLGLNLTAEESAVMDKALSGQAINQGQIEAYVSMLNKLQKEKSLSSDETKLLVNLDGEKKDSHDNVKYLARKKIKDK